MEAIATVVAGPATPSSEVNVNHPPLQHHDDSDSRHGSSSSSHFAVLKPSMTMTSPAVETANVNGIKIFNTRIHDDDTHDPDSIRETPRLRSSRLSKPIQSVAVEMKMKKMKKKTELLDLPIDVLKDIVKEVTHTNDLTSLALCHSALHRLTIPHIYSRFDIVWPDSSAHAEPRSGVDALTYGLATLVMAEEIFGEAPNQQQHRRQLHNNRFNQGNKTARASEMAIRRRRGNHYAQFTKKFSLGNGPPDWVQEYLISKEGGKMLGTLVALAVARMRSLETFVWDMPTGILRDVWLALSSLADREDGEDCRLEKLWVRWHDNSANIDHIQGKIQHVLPMGGNKLTVLTVPIHGTTQLTTIPIPGQQQHTQSSSLNRVEHPSFSVLPPLKSLSVLDIDELAYLDEMAVLVGRSIDKLRELRIGIARHAINKDWVTVWEGDEVHQVDRDYPTAGSMTIGEKRLGGVLGTLTGFVCDMRKPKIVLPDRTKWRRRSSQVVVASAGNNAVSQEPLPVESQHAPLSEVTAQSPLAFTSSPAAASSLFGLVSPENSVTPQDSSEAPDDEGRPPASSTPPQSPTIDDPTPTSPIPLSSTPPLEPSPDDDLSSRLAHQLKLENLELERVPLSIPVLQEGIDWTCLTSITLLHCPNHEQLWKTLRRAFAPRPKSPVYPHARQRSNTSPRKGSKPTSSSRNTEQGDLEYFLNLKKIHTNTVSPALIAFLRETLAPNSLEVLFLQDSRQHSTTVTIDSIYRGPLRRHRRSLQKLLLDSSEKSPSPDVPVPSSSTRWKKWMLTRDILSFITSGKMSSLRELGVGMEYRDWHFFLQRLGTNMHGLRSFYLMNLEGYPSSANGVGGFDARELALQVVDVVVLKGGECEVCYLGIGGKCFEILERRRECHSSTASSEDTASLQLEGVGYGVLPDGEEGEGSDEEEDDDEDEEAGEEDEGTESDEEGEDDDDDGNDDDDDNDIDDEVSELSDEDGIEGGQGGQKLRLREILFYDDKVAVFKARHGRL